MKERNKLTFKKQQKTFTKKMQIKKVKQLLGSDNKAGKSLFMCNFRRKIIQKDDKKVSEVVSVRSDLK